MREIPGDTHLVNPPRRRYSTSMHKSRSGFTTVELLIFIVVVGILAAITIVAYNGIQNRAQDARLRSVASQIEKAIMSWSVDADAPLKAGWGSTAPISNGSCTDGSGGWVESTNYACSLSDILQSKNYIPANLIKNAPRNVEYLPGASSGTFSFMFYPCGSTGKFALYWHLKSPTTEDTASLNRVIAAGCPSNATYRMKAATLLTFS